MQIIKSITAKNILKEYPEIKKQLWDGELWSEGGYIGTVGDGTTSDIIKKKICSESGRSGRKASI